MERVYLLRMQNLARSSFKTVADFARIRYEPSRRRIFANSATTNLRFETSSRYLAAFGVTLLLLCAVEVRAVDSAPDFSRDIFPILRRHCFECHGPKKQEADLRLDQRQAALDHPAAIVPGDSANSEVFRRTTLRPGDEEIMPAVGKPLSKSETELLRRWIDAGAVWPENVELAKHWAYVAPIRPALPKVSDSVMDKK